MPTNYRIRPHHLPIGQKFDGRKSLLTSSRALSRMLKEKKAKIRIYNNSTTFKHHVHLIRPASYTEISFPKTRRKFFFDPLE